MKNTLIYIGIGVAVLLIATSAYALSQFKKKYEVSDKAYMDAHSGRHLGDLEDKAKSMEAFSKVDQIMIGLGLKTV